MQSTSYGTKYSRMDQIKFVEGTLYKFFKGCLPQILLGPFLNTLSHIKHIKINEVGSLRPGKRPEDFESVTFTF